jgi:hypothetical protein
MTPEQYLEVLREQKAIIKAAEDTIAAARDKATNSPPPVLRPARPDDISKGAAIWYRNEEYGWYWNIVAEPLFYGDDWKAYVADDGCLYGLHDAWVKE